MSFVSFFDFSNYFSDQGKTAVQYSQMSNIDIGKEVIVKTYETAKRRYRKEFNESVFSTLESYLEAVKTYQGNQLEQIGSMIKIAGLNENNIQQVIDATLNNEKGVLPVVAAKFTPYITFSSQGNYLRENIVDDVIIKTGKESVDIFKKYLPYVVVGVVGFIVINLMSNKAIISQALKARTK